MKFKVFMGWFVLFVLSFSPVLMLHLFGPQIDLFTYTNFTHYLGQVFGLVGITMFALTFVLSTRLKFIENFFDGLDKVFIVHGIMGGLALTFILFHPILLVFKFIPDNFSTAVSYLLPGHAWAIDAGIIALSLMILLIFITLFTKMKYHKWKFFHEFLGLAFVFAVIHIFLVRGVASRDYIFAGYNSYAVIVSVVGILAFLYSLFLRSLHSNVYYRVEKITKRKNSSDVTMVPLGKPLEYKSGQFVFVRFYNQRLGRESHPFSIASKSNDFRIRVVMKNLGDYTSKFEELEVGNKVLVEGPYGRFSSSKSNANKVWIAGGIGVTPFLGMVEDLREKNIDYKVDMFYSVASRDELISIDSLKRVQDSMNGKFRVFEWISSEYGYLNIDEIIKRSGPVKGKEFYLCGPNALKDNIMSSLIKLGVPKKMIYSEEFSFR